jgi:hypothetical protein
LFLFAISFLLIVKCFFNIRDNFLKTQKKEINLGRIIIISLGFSAFLPVLVIILLILAIFNNFKKITRESTLLRYKLLKITAFIYSPKTQKEIFEPIVTDWQEEYFEALSKKEIWKARWINVRYTYAFIVAMWQKSPIGDLIEFIQKFAK